MINYKKLVKSALYISMFAASSMLFAASDTQSVEMTEDDSVYVMPTLAVDADRATYQALISRHQDEMNAEQMQAIPTHNPVEMIRSQNSSITLGGGLGGATITPRIRGLSSMYTSVTVDGVPVNTPWNWSSPLSGFPLGRLRKITVANGGEGLVYGQNAVAGNVNFVLPTGRDLPGWTMVQEVGGEGTQHQEFMFGHAGEKSEHLVSVFKDKYDGNRRFTDGQWYKNGRDNTQFFYKGAFDLSDGWKFELMTMHNEGTITVGNAWGNYEKFDPWKMSLYNYTLTKEINENSDLSLRYSKYNDYSQDVYYTDNTYTTVQNPGAVDGITNVDMKTIEALYNLKAGDKNQITVGVVNQKVKDSHDSVSKDYQNKELDNTNFFVADSIKVNDKLDIHAVVRSDEDYAGERDVSYSLNAQYEIANGTTFGVGYGHTVMLPTLQDLYMGGKGNTYGNPDLENEKSDNYEIRLSHEVNDKWTVNATYYNYEIEDMITTKKASELGLTGKEWFRDRNGNAVNLGANSKVKTNINEAEISGYEIGINGKINDKFDTWLSYTDFDEAKDKQNNLRLSSTPEYRLTFGLKYHQNKTTATIMVSHQGEMQEIGDPANPDYEKVDSSTIADLYIREQLRKDFAIYLKVANIGDKKVPLSQAQVLRNSDAYYYCDGRIITLGVEMNF